MKTTICRCVNDFFKFMEMDGKQRVRNCRTIDQMGEKDIEVSATMMRVKNQKDIRKRNEIDTTENERGGEKCLKKRKEPLCEDYPWLWQV